MPPNPAISRAVVLSACRRLRKEGREPTSSVLSEETGYGANACRIIRNELVTSGVIPITWRSRGGSGGSRDGIGTTWREDPVIQERVAVVRSAKRVVGRPLTRRELARLLPA